MKGRLNDKILEKITQSLENIALALCLYQILDLTQQKKASKVHKT